MLDIFDETNRDQAVGPLFADGLLSLLRQWTLRPEFRSPTLLNAVSKGAPDVPAFRTLESYKPCPTALVNGGILSVIVLLAVAVAIGRGGSHPAFSIGVHHPSPRVFPMDRASMESKLDAQIMFGPEADDPWRAIATFYFKRMPVLAALDDNGDRIISASEINAAPSALRNLDKDKDGRLTPEECGFFLADSAKQRKPRFAERASLAFMRFHPVLAALDADHDGELSADEIQNSSAALKGIDKNGDGRLTPDELIPDRVVVQAAMILLRLDTDGDGTISARELESEEAEPLRELLESADRNHDGVTRQELMNELRFREQRKRQFANAIRSGGFGPSKEGDKK